MQLAAEELKEILDLVQWASSYQSEHIIIELALSSVDGQVLGHIAYDDISEMVWKPNE